MRFDGTHEMYEVWKPWENNIVYCLEQVFYFRHMCSVLQNRLNWHLFTFRHFFFSSDVINKSQYKETFCMILTAYLSFANI